MTQIASTNAESWGSPERYRFLIPFRWAGGVTIIAAQWAQELAARRVPVEIVFLKDRSFQGSLEQDSELFAGLDSRIVGYDSLDKAERFSKEIVSQLDPRPGDVIVANSCHRNSTLFLSYARQRRYEFRHVELVVNDNRGNYANVRSSLPSCDLVVAISERVYAGAARVIGEQGRRIPLVRIPPGARAIEQTAKPAIDAGCRICYVGRIEQRQKRVFDLVPMLARVVSVHSDAMLTIVGEGSAFETLQQAFESASLSQNVTFTGRRSHAEVLRILGDQHVFVLPSEYEGFAVVFCEGMAAGLVPVTTRVAGPEDVIRHGVNGFLVEVGDVGAMADHVCELAADDSKWRAIAENARRTATTDHSVVEAIDRLLHATRSLPSSRDVLESRAPTAWLSLDSPLVPNAISRRVRILWRQHQARLLSRAAAAEATAVP